MSAYIPKITDIGFDRVVSARGIKAEFVRIGLGDKFFEVTGKETEIFSLREKYQIADATKEGLKRFHITTSIFSEKEYDIYSVGIYAKVTNEDASSEEILFAVISSDKAIVSKKADNEILFGFDLELHGEEATNIIAYSTGDRLNLSINKELVDIATMISGFTMAILEVNKKYNDVLVVNAGLIKRIEVLESAYKT